MLFIEEELEKLLLLEKSVRLPLPPRLDTGKVRGGGTAEAAVEADSNEEVWRTAEALDSRRAPRPDRMRIGEYGGIAWCVVVCTFVLPCSPCACIQALEELGG